ncbi:hypothetical protein E2C01_028053 [Portunus trituberculatus]|uniref:Uncharacterized protein n=1 Tax=Portunus trituberculatus TaxID=210409 RepID=A0A5B7EN70_PORTR|nr:hypothetical protein [Portunus trituberculatus]
MSSLGFDLSGELETSRTTLQPINIYPPPPPIPQLVYHGRGIRCNPNVELGGVTGGNEPPPVPGADETVLPAAVVVRDIPRKSLHPAVSHVGPLRQVDPCVVLWTHHSLLLLASLENEPSCVRKQNRARKAHRCKGGLGEGQCRLRAGSSSYSAREKADEEGGSPSRGVVRKDKALTSEVLRKPSTYLACKGVTSKARLIHAHTHVLRVLGTPLG